MASWNKDSMFIDSMFQKDAHSALGFTAHVMAERFIPEHLVSVPLDKGNKGSGNEVVISGETGLV